ncbi:transposase [Herbidospora sp. NEAU-GS84]|uniref:Transposase n=1 Tax=Herbidospora solisilvae TaxID=2696284 RepID=A0A7C9NY36_9ACTN|nr:transposase [Herbidospora solisilvae]
MPTTPAPTAPTFDLARSGSSLPNQPIRRPTAADQACSFRANRAYLRSRKIRHTIPEPADQKANRRRRGPLGGRPTGYDPARYARRNVVERAINRLKQFRAVATRYDKRGYTPRHGNRRNPDHLAPHLIQETGPGARLSSTWAPVIHKTRDCSLRRNGHFCEETDSPPATQSGSSPGGASTKWEP